MCECHNHVGTHEVQKKLLDPLELESQAVVSCLGWVLETKLRPMEK